MSFEALSIQLTEKKYYNYAFKLTHNKEDAEDLVSEAVLSIHKNTEYFQKAMDGGYFPQAINRCIINLLRDKKRKQKDIPEPDCSTSRLSDSDLWAIEKMQQDQSSNEYYPLLFRKVNEFGGVNNLANETGISKNTIYTGLKKYKDIVMNTKKILLITAREVNGVGYHRILKPYAELKENRPDILLTKSNGYTNKGHDYIVFNRVCAANYEQERAIFNEAKFCGQKVIVDVDDYWILPSGHILENYYKKVGLSKRIEQNIKEADLVTTTNEVLALRILKLNKNVVVIPNAINENDTQWGNYHVHDDTYRFGFVGSSAHTTDVPILRKGCNLMNRGEKNFKFIFVGWSPIDNASKLFEEVFTSRGTGNRYGKIETKPVTQYGMSYNLIDCSLAPLEDNLFNRCKSNLKILEAAAHGLPIICSKIHPYFGSEFDDVVYFAENEYDWYKQMSKLVDKPQEGKERGKAMREIFLENYTYKKVNKLRSEII